MQRHSGILKTRNSILNRQSPLMQHKEFGQMDVEHEKPKFCILKPKEADTSSAMQIEQELVMGSKDVHQMEQAPNFDGCSSEEFARKRRERQLKQNKRVRESFMKRPDEDLQ